MRFPKLATTLAMLLVASFAVACSEDDQDRSLSLCQPGATRCEGIDVAQCNASGTNWVFLKACDNFCTDGACVDACTPDCTGKQCGDDGCGGLCGSCGVGLECHNGTCGPAGCTPDCQGVECGDNGCEGSCGTCPAPMNCQAGLCIVGPCTPDCQGLECGDDGCEGSCGTCGEEQECVEGACQEAAVHVCVLKCTQPADCDPGTGAAYSADNYLCSNGYCEYTGCKSDAECAEMMGNTSYGCYQGQDNPIPYCTLKCSQPADCDQGAGGAYTEANYSCEGGYCKYAGCNDDAECAETFDDTSWGCNLDSGWTVVYCSRKCTQPSDCAPGTVGAYSAENYNCVDSFCEYKGCKSDSECAEAHYSTSYGCN